MREKHIKQQKEPTETTEIPIKYLVMMFLVALGMMVIRLVIHKLITPKRRLKNDFRSFKDDDGALQTRQGGFVLMKVADKRQEKSAVFMRVLFDRKNHSLGLPLGHRVTIKATIDGAEVQDRKSTRLNSSHRT